MSAESPRRLWEEAKVRSRVCVPFRAVPIRPPLPPVPLLRIDAVLHPLTPYGFLPPAIMPSRISSYSSITCYHDEGGRSRILAALSCTYLALHLS